MKKIALVLLISFLLVDVYASQNGTVTASVYVVCPGNIIFSSNTNFAYLRPLNITLNYTISPTSNCVIPILVGNFSLVNKFNQSMVYKKSITLYNISSPIIKKISFGTNNIPNSTYYAELNFYEYSYPIHNYSPLFLLNPANIIMQVRASPNSAPAATQIYLITSLFNNGELASSNITININVSGPQSFNIYKVEPPSTPSAGENIIFTISNLSDAGSYNVTVNAYYNTTLQNQTVRNISIAKTNFSIYPIASSSTPSPIPSPIPVPKPITTLPSIGLVSAPLLISSVQGTSSISQISLINNGNATENVSISVPKIYSSIVSLSATSFAIKPNENLAVQLFFTSNSTLAPGTYIIPLNITASIQNRSSTTKEFLSFTVYSQSNPGKNILNQVLLANNTNLANGILQIHNPTNSTIFNLRISTIIPKLIASNISQISTYGLANNITESQSYYTINWLVSYLPKGGSAYAYYTISKPRNQNLLTNIQSIMTIPTYTQLAQLKVVEMNIPTFYSNSTGKISIEELYTGTSIQPVSILLIAPPGINISPSMYIVNASPNSILSQDFKIKASSPGTLMMSLYLSTQGFNTTYTIPIVVLPIPTNTTIPQAVVPSKPSYLPGYIAAIILLLAILMFLGSRRRREPRYSEERVSSLKGIKEMIKRE
ncbi:MAG: hypothetical protein ACP5RT_01590 [Candidatus Micrarchaeia archaeon]